MVINVFCVALCPLVCGLRGGEAAATIHIRGIDRQGMLRDVAEMLSDKLGLNMRRITVTSNNGIFDGTIELGVHDAEELGVIIENLKQVDDLKEVNRM